MSINPFPSMRQIILFAGFFSMTTAHAVLNISDVPLELSPSLPPNVLILAWTILEVWIGKSLTQHFYIDTSGDEILNSGALCALIHFWNL